MAVGLSVALVSSQVQAQTPAETAKRAAQAEALRVADGWLSSVRDYDGIPALTAGVVVGEELVWAKGYGTLDAAGKIPATPKTIFSICSISKVFTSVALMQQWEAGKVQLDAPIATYLPWATLKPASGDSGPVTLRGALTHSAGLPRESDFPYWTGPKNPFPTREELRARLATQGQLYPAERYFQYSNLGLTLVGETVEAVSGQPYAAYVQASILDPLGLKDTRTSMPAAMVGKSIAVGWGARKRDGTRDLLSPFDARGITPAAGYTSNVEDLAKFAAWQFRLLKTEKPELLKASTLREMQRVQFMDPDWQTSWGLGFGIERVGARTYVGHGGSCPGYETLLRLHPASETAVIVMENAPERTGLHANGVFALLQKREGFAFKAPAPAKDVQLEVYAGRYSGQPFAAEILVTPWAGGLAVLRLPARAPGEELILLKPKGGDIFRRVREDGSEAEEIVFERDAAGKVARYVQFSNPRTLIPETAVKTAPAPARPPRSR
jgi:CubicO group peptidase (beta-lactamase class C family)